MKLLILTPEKEVYRGDAKSVKVPGTSGQFEVLEGHAAIVSSLTEGKIRIINPSGDKLIFQIEKGFIEVLDNEVALLVQGLTKLEASQ